MAILEKLLEKARQAGKNVVLPEGNDPRVVSAANKIIEQSVAKSVIVLGTEEEISKACADAGIEERKFDSFDHLTSDKLDAYAEELRESRAKKGKDVTIEKAKEMMKNRLFYGCMMTKLGVVDAMVAGSIASTGDMLRAAFTVVGTAPGIKSASSCFIMDLATPSPAGDTTLLYADGAVVPEPDAEALVDIALATAKTHQGLIGTQPRVAFVCFSTMGSGGDHPLVVKVRKAAEMAKKIVAEQGLDIVVDGELQADAALVPAIAASKCPNSPLKGSANILVFPDLNVGNTCYKLTQRLAGAKALGPALQGLAYPINDLSRGCSDDDIVATSAIAICQSLV